MSYADPLTRIRFAVDLEIALDATVERPAHRWTVDLVMGRRWWMLPVMAVVYLILSKLIMLSFNYVGALAGTGSLAWMYLCVNMSSVLATAYAAAVLNYPGSQAPHRIAGWAVVSAFGLIAYGTGADLSTAVILHISVTLTLIGQQWFLRWPHWVRKSNDMIQHSVLAKLLALAAALLVVVLSVSTLSAFYRFIAFTLVVGVCILGVLGQFGGLIKDQCRSRRFGEGLIAALLIGSVANLILPVDERVMYHVSCAVTLVTFMLLPPWAICYFHRSDWGRQAVPTPVNSQAVFVAPLE